MRGRMRAGAEQTVDLTIGDLKEDAVAAEQGPGALEHRQSRLGVRLEDLDTTIRGRLDIPERITGAVVAEVQPGSPAAQAGLRPGDVIHEVNGRPAVSADDVAKGVEGDDRGHCAARGRRSDHDHRL